MKNNKKIYLLTALTMLVCGQELSAMGAARSAAAAAMRAGKVVKEKIQNSKVARFVWNNKFAVVGAGLVGNSVVQMQQLHTSVKNMIEEASTGMYPVAIPKVDEKQIKELYASHGFTVSLANMGGSTMYPLMMTISEGKNVILIMNTAAQQAFFDKDLMVSMSMFHKEEEIKMSLGDVKIIESLFGKIVVFEKHYTREHMYAVIYHELGHAEHNDSETKIVLTSSVAPLNFISAVGAYKVLSGLGTYIGGVRGKCAQVVATGLGACAFYAGGKLSVSLLNAFSCRVETRADQYVLDTKDPQLIKAAIDACKKVELMQIAQKISGISSAEHFGDFSGHPALGDRIKMAEQALAELEAANK